MSLKITSISLKGFRTFRKLEIQGLGRVNLITGKNNTGKSSLLEALRLFAWNGAPKVIQNISRQREENPIGLNEGKTDEDSENRFLAISSLFSGFPQLSENPDPIVITANVESRSMKLQLSLDWFVEEHDDEGNLRLIPHRGDLLSEAEGDPALKILTDDKSQMIIRLTSFHRHRRFSSFIGEPRVRQRMSCIYMSPYSGRRTAVFAHYWDQITLSRQAKHVVRALNIIDRRISAVSMVGDNDGERTRTAIVSADNFDRPVPLRSFGDGLNRLFGIVLCLVHARDGLLLIDEFENGLHHTVQHDVWRIIFELARDLNIQIFATSHSWDAVEAFQRAARETPEEGVLIRLTRREEEIIPTVFTEDELAVATRDRIEVR